MLRAGECSRRVVATGVVSVLFPSVVRRCAVMIVLVRLTCGWFVRLLAVVMVLLSSGPWLCVRAGAVYRAFDDELCIVPYSVINTSLPLSPACSPPTRRSWLVPAVVLRGRVCTRQLVVQLRGVERRQLH